jgi:hypothetical protein
MMANLIAKVSVMDCQNGESCLLKKSPKQDENASVQTVSLRDIPLEVRRKDAREPLFLIRYE